MRQEVAGLAVRSGAAVKIGWIVFAMFLVASCATVADKSSGDEAARSAAAAADQKSGEESDQISGQVSGRRFEQRSEELSEPNWPKTVDEAVAVLKKWFTPKDLEWIRNTPKNYVIAELHFPFGSGVRRDFGLWNGNKALLDSCGDDFAETCTDIIFGTLWESVQKDAPTSK